MESTQRAKIISPCCKIDLGCLRSVTSHGVFWSIFGYFKLVAAPMRSMPRLEIGLEMLMKLATWVGGQKADFVALIAIVFEK